MKKQNQWLFEVLPAFEIAESGFEIGDGEWEVGLKPSTVHRPTQPAQQTRSPALRRDSLSLPISAPPLTYDDVRSDRIDVHAQYALLRMSKNPAMSADAVGMAAAVKSGKLGGIYKEDQQVPALRARKMNSSWWLIIPKGEDAVLFLDPDNPIHGVPIIVFRDRIRSDALKLDPALQKAWKSYQLMQMGQIKRCDQAGVGRGEVPVRNVIPAGFCSVAMTSSSCPSVPIEPRSLTMWIQKSLNRTLGINLPINGIFSPQTKFSLQSFQTRHGINPTGIPDEKTKECLTCDMVTPTEDTGMMFRKILGDFPLSGSEKVSVLLTRTLGLPSGAAPVKDVEPGNLEQLIILLNEIDGQVDKLHCCPIMTAIKCDDLKPGSDGQTQSTRIEIQKIKRRIEEIRLFYQFEINQKSNPDDQDGMPNGVTRRQRRVVVSTALAEIGKVFAKDPEWNRDNVIPDCMQSIDRQCKLCFGGLRLKQYFYIAIGNTTAGDRMKCVNRGDQNYIHWCGIFATWVIKSAGIPIANWVLGEPIKINRGKGIFQASSRMPKPGDVGYLTKACQVSTTCPDKSSGKIHSNHHCIIVRWDKETIWTIDGNSVSAGIIVNQRKKQDFISIEIDAIKRGCCPGQPNLDGGFIYDLNYYERQTLPKP